MQSKISRVVSTTILVDVSLTTLLMVLLDYMPPPPPYVHNHYAELEFVSPHGALPAQRNQSKYKTRPSSSRTHTQLPDSLVSPLEAATSNGGNHL